MITHIVVFWGKPELADARERLFAGAQQYLPAIEQVKNFRYGAPLPSERAVVDTSYTMTISMDFESAEDLAAYQVHPLHQAFLEKCVKPLTERILVYDFSDSGPFATGL